MMNSFILLLVIIGSSWIIFEKISNIKDEKDKKIFILLISVLLIAWLDFFSLILLTFYSTVIFVIIKKPFKFIIKNILWFVIINILVLILIKDYYLILDIKNFYVPLGVSYYFFRLISLVIEYSRNPKDYEKISILDYYTYVYFFPIFLAGPIQRFKDFYLLQKPIVGNERKNKYIYLFFVILIKLVLIDIILYKLAYNNLYNIIIYDINSNNLSINIYLFGLVAFLHSYMDLMIYTEISKTISLLLGFSKQENFNKPLLATNISKFWQSWHMSLSNWTRDYVFFPTLIKTKKVWFSTYVSMMIIGIWHSIAWNWLFWAFMHGSALNLYMWLRTTNIYKYMLESRFGEYFLNISGNIITILFVSSVFIFIAIHDSEVLYKLVQLIFHI